LRESIHLINNDYRLPALLHVQSMHDESNIAHNAYG